MQGCWTPTGKALQESAVSKVVGQKSARHEASMFLREKLSCREGWEGSVSFWEAATQQSSVR